jgi:hypothetical protein
LSTNPQARRMSCCENLHSPLPLRDHELVGERLGVQGLAFVASPNSYPSSTRIFARRGYDERDL